MAKQDITVEELVRMIEKGELRLPEMQRRYVWRSTRVRDLLDSLWCGLPVRSGWTRLKFGERLQLGHRHEFRPTASIVLP